jgi:two-component system cell cycle sensor histidine kinase/response regulator CckA
VLDLNAAARDLARRPPEWFGHPVDELVPFLAKTPLGFAPGGSSTLTVTRAADPVYYDVRVMPVRARNDRFAAWVVLLRDVTDQHRTEAERDAYALQMQEQQNRESLSLLAGGLAHDFNNLLTGIVGNADLLALQLPKDSAMQGHLSAIQLGAQRAGDLVSKMLAFAGERYGGFERVDLDALTRDLIDLLSASAARHCTLQYQGTPAEIGADPTQIRQVAMNLIINAAEAVDEEHGTVTVSTRVEDLTQAQLDDMRISGEAGPGRYACLEVVDNGPGMDAQTLRRVFDPFFTTKEEGHGLGLAAVEGIVRGHHGALRVDSTPGKGARFSVWFPLAGLEPGEHREEAPAAGATTPVEVRARRETSERFD